MGEEEGSHTFGKLFEHIYTLREDHDFSPWHKHGEK